jgi:hypothetical protein
MGVPHLAVIALLLTPACKRSASSTPSTPSTPSTQSTPSTPVPKAAQRWRLVRFAPV